jgi:hypothetical protein
VDALTEVTYDTMCEVLLSYDEEVPYDYVRTTQGRTIFADTEGTRYESAVQKLFETCIVHGLSDEAIIFGVKRELTLAEAYKIFARLLVLDYSDYSADAHRSDPYRHAGLQAQIWADMTNKYDTVDQAIDLQDFVDVVIVIMDSYLDNDTVADLDTSSFAGNTITRGDTALFVEAFLGKLYE